MKEKDFIQKALSFKNEKEKLDFSCDIIQEEFVSELKRRLKIDFRSNKKDPGNVKFRKILLAKQLKMSLKRLENILALEERIDLEFIVRVMWATGLVIRVKVRKRTRDEALAAAIQPGKMFPLNEVFGIWNNMTLEEIREKAWGRKQ